jgi:hypothetical protein
MKNVKFKIVFLFFFFRFFFIFFSHVFATPLINITDYPTSIEIEKSFNIEVELTGLEPRANYYVKSIGGEDWHKIKTWSEKTGEWLAWNASWEKMPEISASAEGRATVTITSKFTSKTSIGQNPYKIRIRKVKSNTNYDSEPVNIQVEPIPTPTPTFTPIPPTPTFTPTPSLTSSPTPSPTPVLSFGHSFPESSPTQRPTLNIPPFLSSKDKSFAVSSEVSVLGSSESFKIKESTPSEIESPAGGISNIKKPKSFVASILILIGTGMILISGAWSFGPRIKKLIKKKEEV